jgi:hypothetical protein
MSPRIFSALFACTFLTGCLHVEPTLLADSIPDAASGYVSGMVAMGKTQGLGYAFAIQSVNGGPEYLLSLGAASHFKAHSGGDVPSAIKLPPGTYKVVTWMVYQTLFNEARFRAPLRGDALIGKPFTVRAGSVVHLGNFVIQSEKEFPEAPRIHWTLKPLMVTESASKVQLAASYPNLVALPFRCLLCADTIFAPPP